ncbi:RNA polymerase III subunit C82 [Kalmusia sp. IMI 367209]|nr:RNA polymerase III subunit C82 [Kalmusia sp. IMI 367209]
MAVSTGLRRSARLQQKFTVDDPSSHSRTPIRRRPKKPSIDLERIEEELAVQVTKKNANGKVKSREQTRRVSHFVEAYAEDSDEDEDDETDTTEDEYGELAPLSHDHFEYLASHNLVPRPRKSLQSYDSRLEPGNEDYERNDFVIEDEDDEGSVRTVDSDEDDLEIDMESYRGIGSHRSSLASDRGRRSSSGLFVRDSEGSADVYQLAPWADLGFEADSEDYGAEQPLIADASAEVVEEIIDAIALFSRRVNRNRAPIRLRLAAAVLDDEEIRDALEDTIRTGLGRKLSLADGSKRWSIGPRDRY